MNDNLWATSNIYFDNECCFCGRPYVSLIAYKEKNKFWDANTIGIGLRDNDDFDYFDIVTDWGERCIKEGITRETISINEMLFVV